ncbi:hypothetical protein ABT263_08370 [Kitasatospora sp. NPDC001603]|uniref:hypothetical protein n=1 Tax=Kitasatospora sp. NPDC001603 TaxID=3154388 RepID=UPI00331F5D8F
MHDHARRAAQDLLEAARGVRIRTAYGGLGIGRLLIVEWVGSPLARFGRCGFGAQDVEARAVRGDQPVLQRAAYGDRAVTGGEEREYVLLAAASGGARDMQGSGDVALTATGRPDPQDQRLLLARAGCLGHRPAVRDLARLPGPRERMDPAPRV